MGNPVRNALAEEFEKWWRREGRKIHHYALLSDEENTGASAAAFEAGAIAMKKMMIQFLKDGEFM